MVFHVAETVENNKLKEIKESVPRGFLGKLAKEIFIPLQAFKARTADWKIGVFEQKAHSASLGRK